MKKKNYLFYYRLFQFLIEEGIEEMVSFPVCWNH